MSNQNNMDTFEIFVVVNIFVILLQFLAQREVRNTIKIDSA